MEKNVANLLYGLDNTERIVSIEVRNNTAEIFQEDKDGNTIVTTRPNKNWILCNRRIDKTWHRLAGDLHYKYIKFLTTDNDFWQIKKAYEAEDLFFINDAKERFMVKNGLTYFKGLKHTEVSILSFDIETTTLEHNNDAKILLIANTFRRNGRIIKKMFCYDDYDSQGEMLRDWCDWITAMDPSIITGHNINMFDLPYIYFIAQEEDVELLLGRNSSPIYVNKYESDFRKDGSQFYQYHKFKIHGREVIDTFFLALKYDISRKYENYKLKYIINYEKLEKANRQFYDADQIRFKYKIPEEWKKIKAYAADDGDDALALYDLMCPSFFYSAQMIPKSYQLITESAEGSKVNSMMVRSYFQQKHSLPAKSDPVEYEGAISIGNPGIYKNVYKVDVASLYPSIMIEFEVYDEKKDPERYFLTIVEELTTKRLANKKLAKETGDKYYKGLEAAQKLLINSAYGFLGAPGLIFNSPEKAAFVTATGREILQTSIDWSEKKGFKLVNADTDSISFSRATGDQIDEKERSALLIELNSLFPKRIRFEDDGYYTHLIVIKAKNYVKRSDKGHIEYKGSAIKATTKEPALQQFIQDIIKSILNDKFNYIEIYDQYVKEIMNLKDIKRWVSKKTVTDKVLESERTNEAKVRDAIEDTDYAQGDKIYVYFDSNDKLKLVEDFDGDYNKDKLLHKLFSTSKVFNTIIPKETFVNYKLKKNKKLLEGLDGINNHVNTKCN